MAGPIDSDGPGDGEAGASVEELRAAVDRLTARVKRDAETIADLEARLKAIEAGARAQMSGPRGSRSLLSRLIGPGTKTRGGRKKIAVIAWNMAANPVGRAYLLAEMLSRRHDVEIIGPSFVGEGRPGLWKPIATSPMCMRHMRGRDFPDFLADAERLAATIEADILYVCKPRLPSMLVGMLARERLGVPVIVDVDDLELAFFAGAGPASLPDYDRAAPALDSWVPKAATWTQLCEALVAEADLVTVPNPVLQARYGGIVVRHARNESVFAPDLIDRAAERARFGYGDSDRVVLFLGTPRLHKGIVDVTKALDRIGNPRFVFALVGGNPGKTLGDELSRFPRARVDVFGPEPFNRLAETVSIADLVCLLQDPDSAVATAQTPAKVTDALAMNVPILANRLPPLEDLMDGEALVEADEGRLDEQIAAMLEAPRASGEAAIRRRDRFLSEFSYAANLDRLDRAMASLRPKAPGPVQKGLLERIRRRFGRSAALADPLPIQVHCPPPVDVVLLRGGSNGQAGTRLSGLLTGLAQAGRVRRIIAIDGPIAAEEADRQQQKGAKRSRRDPKESDGFPDGKVIRSTFTYGATAEGDGAALAGFPAFVKAALDEAGIRGEAAVLIANLGQPRLRETIDAIAPAATAIDVTGAPARFFGQFGEESAIIVAADAALVRQANPAAKEAHLLPDGIDFSGTIPPRPARRPEEVSGRPGPLIGVGAPPGSTVDPKILSALAERRPNWTFVLTARSKALAAAPNLLDLSRLPAARRQEVVRSLDVALLPLADGSAGGDFVPAIAAGSFLAEGVPVVSTVAPGSHLPLDAIAVASGVDAIARAIDSALSGELDPRRHPTLSRWLAADSWQARADRLLHLIDRQMGS